MKRLIVAAAAAAVLAAGQSASGPLGPLWPGHLWPRRSPPATASSSRRQTG